MQDTYGKPSLGSLLRDVKEVAEYSKLPFQNRPNMVVTRMQSIVEHHRRLGEAVQVDPMKPELKPPGSKLIKLKCDIMLSTSGFKFNLRRYSWATCASAARSTCTMSASACCARSRLGGAG
jgi:hypothetical protein